MNISISSALHVGLHC